MELRWRPWRSFALPSLDFLRLRPYGDHLATPAVRIWIGFAWIVILLMASIEGTVWGFVGASIVPQAAAWLRPVAGLFMFVLMFAIIWIVDASLILSERPVRAKVTPTATRLEEPGAQSRWLLGLLMRVLIVAVSLYVTAPFLAKLIRADDIEGYHQRLVEQYYAEREAAFQRQLDARARETETRFASLIQPIEDEIARLNRTLDAERERRDQIEAEYAPEIKVLRAELAAAQERLGDEIHGRDERPAGYGPEARRWDARANALVAELASKQSEIDGRVGQVASGIADLEERLRARLEDLQRLRLERQEQMEHIRAEVAAQQPEELPPRLTFAARSKALQALRESPDEAGVPHFETVDGFAQAALAILFFSLIALKLFEPPSVRAYFNEGLQFQYRKYLEGGLGAIPGFDRQDDPKQRLSPVEFARLWRAYEGDPLGFFADQGARVEAADPYRRIRAEQEHAQTLTQLRHDNLRQELELAQRRREVELAAYENDQRLRASELRVQLADETRAKQHHRRVELEHELQRARETWALHKAQEEEDLRQRMIAFEQTLELAREDRRLRERELETQYEQRMEALRQAELEHQRRERRERAEQEARLRDEERCARLAALREELTRVRELETRCETEAATLRETAHRLTSAIDARTEQIKGLEQEIAGARTRIEAVRQGAESGTGATGGFWSRREGGDRGRMTREVRRELKNLEQWVRDNAGHLARLRDDRAALEVRRLTNADQLAAVESRLDSARTRIRFHEDAIGDLLARAHVEPPLTEDA